MYLIKSFKKCTGYEKLGDFISRRDRSLLTYEFLSRTSYSRKVESGNLNISEADNRVGIERLIANGTFLDAYPAHESLDKMRAENIDPDLMEENHRRQVVFKLKNIFI